MVGLVWENAKWQQIGHVFFLILHCSPFTSWATNVSFVFYAIFFLDFSRRKLDPITTLGVATTHFLTPNVQQGNQVLTKLPSPLFHLCSNLPPHHMHLPILSTHKFKSKKSSNPSILVYLIQFNTHFFFCLFSLASLGLASINVFGVWVYR